MSTHKSLKIVGKKEGMTRVFDEKGRVVVCTIVSADKNIITQVKNLESDGYQAVQMGARPVPDSKKRNVTKPMQGHYAKAKVTPRRVLFENRLEDIAGFEVGDEFGLELFSDVAYVDVTGVSKGKGFQGVVKRYGFRGGRATHGCSRYHRGSGSTGMRSTPGRVFPGQKKAGHMGSEKVTVECLKVVRVDAKNQYILIKGAIPGPAGSVVTIRKSKKKG